MPSITSSAIARFRAIGRPLPHGRGSDRSRDGKGVVSKMTAIVLPAATVLSLFLLAGCMVGPNYKRPNVNAPAAFRGAPVAAQQASFADLPWWEVFKDESLKELIKTSLANNYDLDAAIARVEQARQIAATARSEYFPAINYTSATTYGHNQFINSPASNSPGAQGFFLGIASATLAAAVWGR